VTAAVFFFQQISFAFPSPEMVPDPLQLNPPQQSAEDLQPEPSAAAENPTPTSDEFLMESPALSQATSESDSFPANSPAQGGWVTGVWTPAPSNPVYAFRMTHESSGDKLEVGHSWTGQTTVLFSGGDLTAQTVADVSPDASVVVYGTVTSSGDSAVYVQNSLDPEKRIALTGVLENVRFDSDRVRLGLSGSRSAVVLLPASASETPQLLTTDYFNPADGSLERIEIAGNTGGVAATVPVVFPEMIAAPNSHNQWTMQIDSAMKGLRYEVQYETSADPGVWQTAESFVADRYGKISWQDPLGLRSNLVAYRVIPKEMTSSQDLLTQANLLYFDPRFGMVDEDNPYPFEGWSGQNFTQPSNFGFYAYLLAEIAAGNLVTYWIDKTEAVERLDRLTTQLLADQDRLGIAGLLPWFGYYDVDRDGDGKMEKEWMPLEGSYGHQAAFEDNTNLSAALAVAYGALLDESLADNPGVHRGQDGILAKIDAFLEAQREGYDLLYEENGDYFHQTIQEDRAVSGTVGYFGAESSSPMLFLSLQYGFPSSPYTDLHFQTRTYTRKDDAGNVVFEREVLSPWSGAFQIYWPALLMPESMNPDLRGLIETYTDVQLDFAREQGHPGFLSASNNVVDAQLVRRRNEQGAIDPDLVQAFSWANDHFSTSWEGGDTRYHLQSPTNNGIGVAFNHGPFTFQNTDMVFEYASDTVMPNARLEFKRVTNGVTELVSVPIPEEDTNNQVRQIHIPWTLDPANAGFDEIVFAVDGDGRFPLDFSLVSLRSDRVMYDFPLGIGQIANVTTVETTPSVYSLGGAHMFRPEAVDAMLDDILEHHRDLISEHGLWEGKNVSYGGRVVYEQVFNNIVTFVVGMTGNGPDYMARYLDAKGLSDDLDAVWNPQATVSLTEGGTPGEFEYTADDGVTYEGVSWRLGKKVIASGRRIRLTYQSPERVEGAKLELKHAGSNAPIFKTTFDLEATGQGSKELWITVPENGLYWGIGELVILFPQASNLLPLDAISGLHLTPEPEVFLEAENMAASGDTWNGGSFNLLWGNGQLTSDVVVDDPGIYDIEIIANANDAANPSLPQMRVTVDGDTVAAPLDMNNDNWQFHSFVLSGVELAEGSHRLELEAFRTAAGQAIAVDKILLHRRGAMPYRDDRMEFQAETMTASGWTWNGGEYVIVWANGEVKAVPDIAESGIYEVEVYANAYDAGNSQQPQIRVSLGSDMIQGPLNVPGGYGPFQSYKWSGIELTAGHPVLSVGAFLTAAGQWIAVDKIILRKTGEIPYRSARRLLEAEGMSATGGHWRAETYALLWGDGALAESAELSEPGVYEVEIAAAAYEAGNPVRPKLSFSIDGNTPATMSVSNGNWQFQSYKFTVQLSSGAHDFLLAAGPMAPGQYLAVDRIVLRKISEIPEMSPAQSAQAPQGSEVCDWHSQDGISYEYTCQILTNSGFVTVSRDSVLRV